MDDLCCSFQCDSLKSPSRIIPVLHSKFANGFLFHSDEKLKDLAVNLMALQDICICPSCHYLHDLIYQCPLFHHFLHPHLAPFQPHRTPMGYECAKLTLTSGQWHLLFLLPGILFLYQPGLPPVYFQAPVKMTLYLRGLLLPL